MPLSIDIQFADEENKERLSEAVLRFLENDHEARGQPEKHFWHNRRIIGESYDECKGMAVFNEDDEVIGYMVWTWWEHDCSAEIDIVEVEENCRRQGVFKAMLSAFLDRFREISVLTSSVIEDAVDVFKQAGWQLHDDPSFHQSDLTYFHKCMRQGLIAHDSLPDGLVIGIYSQVDEPPSGRYVDYYRVAAESATYQLKYFQIEMGKDGWLKTPIISSFHCEGYIGIYLNRELLVANKAKYLFGNDVCVSRHDLLAISRIMPKDSELFYARGLLDRPPVVAEDPEGLSSDGSESESSPRLSTVGDFVSWWATQPSVTSSADPSMSGQSSPQGGQGAGAASHQDKRRRVMPTDESFGDGETPEQGPGLGLMK